jgi:thiol-disulfide isomerase/thioredoxin
MDRLPVVRTTALLLLLTTALCTSCEERKDTIPTVERVNAVKATKPKAANDTFCDKTPNTPFAFPKLSGAAPQAASGTWRWINVWATWCKPCLEELPRLHKWQGDLEREGRKVKLVLLSIDESDDELSEFRFKHKDFIESQRVADPKEHAAFFKSLGLDEGAPVPIHVFVDPQNNVRCVRAGGVRDKDYAAISEVLASK